MMNKVFIEQKWISAETATLIEKVNVKGKKEKYIEALIVPFNKISRNGVLYSKESVLNTKDQIIGKPLNHNHETDGRNNFSRGEWIASWETTEGLMGRAKVYQTSYNKEYIEWLEACSNIPVSLQISGEAEQVKKEDDTYYQKADVNDWLEISTVLVPGFIDAKARMETVLAEAFNTKPEDNNDFFESLNKIRESNI